LIWLIGTALLRNKFNISIGKQHFVFGIEMLENVALVKENLTVEEQKLIFVRLLLVAEISDPACYE